jgi:hypothetical protein
MVAWRTKHVAIIIISIWISIDCIIILLCWRKSHLIICYTSNNHPFVNLLEELSTLVDKPGRGENEQPLISEYYKEVTPHCHLIQSGNWPLAFNYKYESILYEARVPSDEGRQIKEAEDHNEGFKKIFRETIGTSKCFTTDGWKMESEQFLAFASIDIVRHSE